MHQTPKAALVMLGVSCEKIKFNCIKLPIDSMTCWPHNTRKGEWYGKRENNRNIF